MTSQPKISVLVPVYNGEKFLAECLDSILMQDFSDYELLISDDCSTDGTVAVIEHYAAKDPRIRWWRNPVNLKQAANLNLCLRAARGEFIKFVFADDKLLAPSALRQMVQVLAADPTIALVGSASHVITADGRVIQVRDFFRDNRRQAGMKLLMQCLEQPVNLIGEPTVVMFRRSAAGRGFDEHFRQLVDLEFWFHLLEQGDFACLAEPLSAFRRHAAQETEVIRHSGTSARDEIPLKKTYYPRAWERRAVSGWTLFNLLRELQKHDDEPTAALAATIKQTLGRSRRAGCWLRYRGWRLLQDLKILRARSPAIGKPLLESVPTIPTASGQSGHPLVSVLIPVYNGEKYLAECLDSVLAQDFVDMEILIADDGSTDGSRELIRRYAEKDSRIRWWRNPVNLGLAGNFNACLRAARGQYIKYVLQDDKLLAPLAIWKMAEILDQHPAVSLVGSASEVIDGQSQLIELRNAFQRSSVIEGHAAILHCLSRNGNRIGEPSVVMFRRAQAARGFDERYRQLIDLDFWFHLLEQGCFGYLAEPLCAFRQHAEQQTAVNRQSGAHVQDELMLAQHWLSRPWLRKSAGRRVLFQQIYNLRKHHGERARPFIGDIMASLTAKWYALYWLEYKIFRPFRNLDRSLRKRFVARPGQPKAAKG
jgi:glycosyltransferase involved in cell wall biosynthesis